MTEKSEKFSDWRNIYQKSHTDDSSVIFDISHDKKHSSVITYKSITSVTLCFLGIFSLIKTVYIRIC